jgi:MFS family permease
MSTSTPSDRGAGVDQTRTDQPPVRDAHAHPDTHTGHTVVTDEPVDRRSVLARQKEEHGGVKIGSAFFGFLTAVGVGVLLTALLTAAGAAIGLATGTDASEATDVAESASIETVGLVGGILLLVVVFLAYYAGGYVAGRMARFNGAKQGLAVWLWALVVAAVVAVLGMVAGDQYDILADLNTFPRIPVSEGELTRGGAIAAAVLVGVSLLGALAGGLAGMRFHRAVDKTGLPR